MSTRDSLLSTPGEDQHGRGLNGDAIGERLVLSSLSIEPPSADCVRKVTIDVIVPIFNALEDVKRCFDALLRHADAWPLRIIAVNDGSDTETTSWLREQTERFACVHLIEHSENRGYTRAANSGLRASSAAYVVVLNSDTIVTRNWLQRLIECAESSPKIGIVGPLSNAASWQSVPLVKDASGFVVNTLPPGVSPDDMANIVAATSKREFPRSTFINGFCFLISRRVIDAIGMFDEIGFPCGYGEENDYCIRAQKAGFELAIANHCYVYHAKSKSFGHSRRKELSAIGARIIREKHGDGEVSRLIAQVQVQPELDAQRLSIQRHFSRVEDAEAPPAQVDPLSLRILFLLPTRGGGGGAHSVVQEVCAMRRLGVDARVAVRPSDLKGFLERYAEIPSCREMIIPYAFSDINSRPEGYDVVVATVYSSVRALAQIAMSYPEVLPAYYVQDYEPLFFEAGTDEHRTALDSYAAIHNAVLFAKTDWIIRTIADNHSILVHKVEPSLDHEVYRPRPRLNDGVIRIAAMVRPQTPRRGAERTMRVLKQLSSMFADRVAIHVFGCETADYRFRSLTQDFPFRNYGPLKRTEVSELLAQCDVFVDLSDYQAFGRTALEAMACGCATLVPAKGGTDEYAIHGHNSLVVDTNDEAACVEHLARLVSDKNLRMRFRRESLKTAARYSTHGAAVSELNVLAEAFQRHRAQHRPAPRRRLALIPSQSQGGGIAGSGYVRMEYPWQSPPVRRLWTASVNSARLPSPGQADIAILQREAFQIDIDELAGWLERWRGAGAKFVFEVDDDLMNRDALLARKFKRPEATVERVRWLAQAADAVVVSTEPLREDYLSLNANVYLLPNFLDGHLWRLGLAPITEPKFRKQPGDPIRIGYIGTPTHDDDLALLTPVVERIKEEYGDKVVFEVVGAFQKRPPLWGEKIGLPRNHAYPEFVDWLQRRINWDIGVIPLLDDGFCRRKSGVKFLEYSALRLATVCSDVEAYRRVVRHESNGLLVPNTADAWYHAIKRLITEAELRERLSSVAYADVSENHSTAGNARVYLDTLESILQLPKRSEALVVPRSLRTLKSDGNSRGKANANTKRNEGTAGGKVPRTLGEVSISTADFEAARTRMAIWKRKLAKLRRNPRRFVTDSKVPVIKLTGRIFGIRE